MQARTKITKNGFQLNIDQDLFSLVYPTKYWENFKPELKKFLASTYSFVRVRPLAMILDNKIIVERPGKTLSSLVDYGLIGDLPRVADIINKPVQALLGSYQKSAKKINYLKPENQAISFPRTLEKRIVIPMSFGKDSLLTYGLAREIGAERRLVFVQDTDLENKYEYQHKFKLIAKFESETKEKIEKVVDDIDEVFYRYGGKSKIEDLENANAILAFVLELMPIAATEKARYIVLGNEQNLNDHYLLEGYKAYPSFDQSAGYAKKLNQYLSRATNDNIQVASLVEPLYNIAEMKILYNRYPDLLKYVMSCTITVKSRDRWCYNCPMCAKAFLYSSAFGSPRLIGMNQNMFEAKYEKLYPLFMKKITRPYEKPAEVRDEQLLAFLLAYRSGAKGDLIRKFARLFLAEAEDREHELRNKFFKIYKTNNIPKKFIQKLNKIFQEELISLL